MTQRKFRKKQGAPRPKWGHDLFDFREGLGLTQSQMCDRIGINQEKWSKWERGQKYPNMGELKRIESGFNVRIEITRDENEQRRFYFHKINNPNQQSLL